MTSARRAGRLMAHVWGHPANRSAGERIAAVGRLALWQVRQRVTHRPMSFQAFGDLTMRLYPHSHATSALYYNRVPDYWEMSFVRRVLRPGDRFVDVGANEGIYTLLAASLVGAGGAILSVEPNPVAGARLRENLERNRLAQVRVHQAAAGERPGWARLSMDRGPMNFVEAAAESAPAEPGWSELVTLDDLCAGAPPMFAKVDVEGYELQVLRGARRLLHARRPAAWLLELNQQSERFGASPAAVRDFLRDHGARLFVYDPASRRLADYRPQAETHNVLAILDEQAVAERLQV